MKLSMDDGGNGRHVPPIEEDDNDVIAMSSHGHLLQIRLAAWPRGSDIQVFWKSAEPSQRKVPLACFSLSLVMFRDVVISREPLCERSHKNYCYKKEKAQPHRRRMPERSGRVGRNGVVTVACRAGAVGHAGLILTAYSDPCITNLRAGSSRA